MRKLLTFTNEAGERVRILWTDGVCRTPDALAKVANGTWAWDGIRTSGGTWEPKPKMKFVAKKVNADNPEFLGIQNPPKAQPKPVELDAEGKAVPKRTRKALDPALLESIKDACVAEKTMKQTAEELGIPYPLVVATAKKHGMVFKRGKKGGGGKKAKAVDPAFIEDLRKLAEQGMTIREAAQLSDVPYPKVYVLAKNAGIVFKAGQRGRKKVDKTATV